VTNKASENSKALRTGGHFRLTVSRVAKFLLLTCLTTLGQVSIAQENALIDISHVTLAGNQQQLAFTMSGPAQEPQAFTIDNPARIAMDLPNTSNALKERTIQISSGLLQNITTVEAGGRTRVVINLASRHGTSIIVSGAECGSGRFYE